MASITDSSISGALLPSASRVKFATVSFQIKTSLCTGSAASSSGTTMVRFLLVMTWKKAGVNLKKKTCENLTKKAGVILDKTNFDFETKLT